MFEKTKINDIDQVFSPFIPSLINIFCHKNVYSLVGSNPGSQVALEVKSWTITIVRALTYFVRGSISEQLTSCLTGFDLAALLMLN